MQQSKDRIPSFSELLRQAMGPALKKDAQNFLDMCAEDIVFEFPFAPPAAVHRLEGKDALADYLPRVADLVEIESMQLVASHEVHQNESYIIEFTCRGISRQNDARYDQDYISVIKLRDGLIIHYKDYWNPLVVLQTADTEEQLRAILKGNIHSA